MTKLKPYLEKDIETSIEKIKNLSSAQDVADFLELPVGQLLHILYKQNKEKQCKKFLIPKKMGGHRLIVSPLGGKRILQEKLKPIFQNLYKTKACVHGFVNHKSIVSNARQHKKKRFILNIDLKNFFPTIHFGRIRGLFMGYPFNMGEKAATVMAEICTQDSVLTQGSPLSPILSNFISSDLDRKLTKIAQRYKMTYTRYADDITFSSSQNNFPSAIATWDGTNPVVNTIALGNLLVENINSAGFEINYDKVRLQIKPIRQEVTGLIVNEFPNIKRSYIRNIRGMINAWRKYGVLNAEKTLIHKYSKSSIEIDEEKLNGSYFKNVLYGKIAFVKMVRGEHDEIYMKLCLAAASLDQTPPKFIQRIKSMHEMYDVFLSHASEDKDNIAEPIYNELKKLGVNAFLDKIHIGWGDSLTEKINHALGQSKLVLAVLSESSVGKTWPMKELNSALARELSGRQKILPLIIGNPDLSLLSLLEDKLYINWGNNPEEIAQKIYQQLYPK